jgi:4-hydroxy-3-methylbut-2-enyl diphosphate reductase
VAREYNRPAHLVDDVSEIDLAWFRGDETVLITAGASAPEEVVSECVDYLVRRFGATVEHQALREESVEFPLPLPVRLGELLPLPEVAP